MTMLQQLIDDATALANPDDTMHGGRLWRSEGGRACPIGWDHCSQPVFVDLRTGDYDYGDLGGPGHASCKATCHEGMQPPEPEEEEQPRSSLVFPTFRLAANAAKQFTEA